MTIDDLIEIEERLVVGKFKQKFYAHIDEFDDREEFWEDEYYDDWYDTEVWDQLYAEEVAAGLYEDVQPYDPCFPGWTDEEIDQYYRELDAMYEDEGW